jgi:hypothetical protein
MDRIEFGGSPQFKPIDVWVFDIRDIDSTWLRSGTNLIYIYSDDTEELIVLEYIRSSCPMGYREIGSGVLCAKTTPP